MTLAAPLEYVLGGIFLGLTLQGFSRHKLLGWVSLLAGIGLIVLASMGTTLRIQSPQVNHPPAVHSTAPASPGATR